MTCNHPWRALLFVSVLLLPGVLTLADQKADDEALIGKRLDQFETYVYEGNYGRAAIVVQLLWTDHYKNPDVKVADARARLIRGDVQTAQNQVEAVLKEHPDHPLATATLAFILVSQYQTGAPAARTAVDDALKVYPDAWPLLQTSGELYVRENKLEQAAQVYTRIIDNPDSPPYALATAHVSFASILFQQNQFAQAATHYKAAIDLIWTLQPAVGYALALDKADSDLAGLAQAVEDIRRRINNAVNDENQAQARKYVDEQFVQIDKKLAGKKDEIVTAKDQAFVRGNLKDIDAELAKDDADFKYDTAVYLLRAAEGRAIAITETAIRDRLLAQITPYYLKVHARGVSQAENSGGKVGTTDRLKRAVALKKAAQKAPPSAEAKEALELANQIIQRIAGPSIDAALSLARDGWMLERFMYPSKEDEHKLSWQLPRKYADFSEPVKDALAEFYQPLADARPTIPLEQAVLAYIQNPSDAALRTRVIELTRQRIADLDPNDPTLNSSAIIPWRIWPRPDADLAVPVTDAYWPEARRKSNAAKEVMKNLGIRPLQENQKWHQIVPRYTYVIENFYPAPDLLLERATFQLLKGSYVDATEDTILALAVDAWAQANSMRHSEPKYAHRRVELALSRIKQYSQMTTIKRSAQGSDPYMPLDQVLVQVRFGEWSQILDILIDWGDYPNDTTEYWIYRTLIWGEFGSWRDSFLDEVAARYRQLVSFGETDEAEVLWGKFQSRANRRASTALIGFERAVEAGEEDQKVKEWLESAAKDPSRNAAAYYELGRYLSEKDKVQAMLAYNVAARGGDVQKLSGLQRSAAIERNQLEGPTPDFASVFAAYRESWGAIVKKQELSVLEAAYVEAMASRLMDRGARRDQVLPVRGDARWELGDKQGTVSDYRELIKLKPEFTGMFSVLLGRVEGEFGNYRDAIDLYTYAIANGEDSGDVYALRAGEYAHMMQFDRMLADLDVAIEKEPKDYALYVQRADYYEYIKNDVDKALENLTVAAQLMREQEVSVLDTDRRVRQLRERQSAQHKLPGSSRDD